MVSVPNPIRRQIKAFLEDLMDDEDVTTDFAGQDVKNANLDSATFKNAVDANSQDINNVGAIGSERIVDTTDGQDWETLREAGFETGDFVACGPSTFYEPKVTYTSITYVDRAQQSWDTTWNNWAPSGGTTGVLVHFGVSGGTADIRLYNKTDDEVAFEILNEGSQADTVEYGPFEYTPTTRDSVIDIVPQIRESVADSGPKVNKFLLQYGVFL